MDSSPQVHSPAWPLLAWSTVAAAGFLVPAILIVALANMSAPIPPTLVAGPALAVGTMGAGMIGAAAAGRLWIGVLLAALAGSSLIMFAHLLGMSGSIHLPVAGLAIGIAGISFAARGALFARSAAGKGWWVAVLVVAGEAAILLSASVQPGIWPDWLLVLLPAQWANLAFQTALGGNGIGLASSAMIALGGTAVATLLVVRLWPRRWPYLVMFTTWLGMAALVHQHLGAETGNAPSEELSQSLDRLAAEEGIEAQTLEAKLP